MSTYRRRRRRCTAGAAGDEGMVTAELAVAMPVFVVLLCLAMGAVTAATAQLRCVDAARAGARAVARGESPHTAMSTAQQAAPPGAVITVERAGSLVRVVVTGRVGLLGPLRAHPLAVPVRAVEVAEVEPGRTHDAPGSPGCGSRPAPRPS